jgi:flavin-dependent dehydrogenase
MQAEVCVPSEVLARWHSTIGRDLGYMSGGYGWVFPKKDHLSIGVGTWGANTISVKSLKPYFERLLRSLSLGDYSIASLKGHLMPLRRRGAAIQRNNILLLGDAAGLIHTYTGEGIYYAIRSAQLAAPLIAKSLETNAMELYNYEKAVDEELMPSLQAARGLAALLHYPHYLCFVGAKRSERVWRAACRLVRGERSEVKQELGLLRFPVKLLGAMSQRRK